MTVRRLGASAVVASFIATATLVTGPPASADGGSETSAAPPADASDADAAFATEQYERGRRLLNEGKPRAALEAIEASLQRLPSANTELLKAHALRLLDRRPEALLLYERVMQGAGARVRAGEERFRATLADAGKWAATLRAELGEIDVTVANAPPGTTVTVDGATVDLAPDAAAGILRAHTWHAPGRVRVVAGTPSVRRSDVADLEPGIAKTVRFDLSTQRPSPRSESNGPPLASWIAAGIGVAGVGVFAVFGALAEKANADLDCTPHCTDPALHPTEDRRDRDATIANVSLLVGATGLVTAGLLWAFWPSRPSSASAASAVALASTRGTSIRLAF